MTVTSPLIYEITISRGNLDSGISRLVRRTLEQSGLTTIEICDVISESSAVRAMREMIAACSAFVVILTRSTLNSRNVPLKVGMALAWNKPIFVLYDGIAKSEIPIYLRSYNVFPLAKLANVVRDIKKAQQPISDGEHDALVDAYCGLGVPTDQLLGQPLRVRELAEEFQARTKTALSGEKLVQELIRLRKQGKLPKLKRQ